MSHKFVAICIDETASNQLIITSGGCICRGHSITFVCNATGGGSTVWQGSAFDCPSSSSEIFLLHSQYTSSNRPQGLCNSGAIEAHAIGIDQRLGVFTSQLVISNLSLSLNGMTVECAHDSGVAVNIIGTSVIAFTTGIGHCTHTMHAICHIMHTISCYIP